MAHNRKPGKVKRWILVFLLALVCIGGMELLVCRYADPDLYYRITDPIRQSVSSLGSQIVNLAQRLTVQPKPEPDPTAQGDSQYSSDPAIWSKLTAADPTITEFKFQDEQEILTGGTHKIIYYHQMDDAWRDRPYGTDTIGPYGCGPTVMAMTVSSLTKNDMDPAEMAAWSKNQGYWAKGSGSSRALIPGAAESFGLAVETRDVWTPSQLRLDLASGKMAVALVSKGHFTQKGHFILLRGTTLDGGILVADPNSRERSLVVWDAQLILDELSGKQNQVIPLWLLYPAPAEYESEESVPAP